MHYDPRSYDEVKALAKTLRRRIETVITLHENTDPFFAGAPRRLERANWFAALWDNWQIKVPIHVRSIHYRLISQKTPVRMPDGEPYENTVKCQAMLNEAARDARYLEFIPANLVIDRRNPSARINLDGTEDQAAEIEVEAGVIEQTLYGTSYRAPEIILPSLVLHAPTVSQRYHLEIWVEKSTMNDVVVPLGEKFGVNVATFSGECSTTACEDLVRRAIASGRPVRIFHVTDFDPRGQTMPISAARKIEYIAKQAGKQLDIRLTPIALTLQQCVDFALPRTPIKETEGMAADFEARFGAGATELDALEALHPGALRRILEEEIEVYLDDELDDEIDDMVTQVQGHLLDVAASVQQDYAGEIASLDEERQAINLAFRQVFEPAREAYVEACRLARATFETTVEQCRDEITTMEANFVARAQPIIETINAATEQAAPAPEHFDWPEPAEANEDDDPLYDSGRSYLDQVERFRKHQGKDADDPTLRRLIPLTCEVCGQGFTSSQVTTKACSGTCRSRRRRAARVAELRRTGSSA